MKYKGLGGSMNDYEKYGVLFDDATLAAACRGRRARTWDDIERHVRAQKSLTIAAMGLRARRGTLWWQVTPGVLPSTEHEASCIRSRRQLEIALLERQGYEVRLKTFNRKISIEARLHEQVDCLILHRQLSHVGVLDDAEEARDVEVDVLQTMWEYMMTHRGRNVINLVREKSPDLDGRKEILLAMRDRYEAQYALVTSMYEDYDPGEEHISAMREDIKEVLDASIL